MSSVKTKRSKQVTMLLKSTPVSKPKAIQKEIQKPKQEYTIKRKNVDWNEPNYLKMKL